MQIYEHRRAAGKPSVELARVGAASVPIPYSETHELEVLTTTEKIIKAVRQVLA